MLEQDRRSASEVRTAFRLRSLDQFRGYTVAGMFAVNFLRVFESAPEALKHHDGYCSYADTIEPHFFFAVGYALRLVTARQTGSPAVFQRLAKRALMLVVTGTIVYHLDASAWRTIHDEGFNALLLRAAQRQMWQALVHIGMTTLWVYAVIRARPCALLAFAVTVGLLHLALSNAFYLEWMRSVRTLEGGPLGFLSWSLPTIAGAYACHVVTEHGPSASLARLLRTGVIVALIGFGLSCVGGNVSVPFVFRGGGFDLWTMSQRAGTTSYQTFCAGVSLVLFAGFVRVCDVSGLESRPLLTLGRNPLAAYLLHLVLLNLVRPWLEYDAGVPLVLAVFVTWFAVVFGVLKTLERRGLYLRL